MIDLPDSHWGTYGRHDKPITTTQVTRLLKPYGIKSGSVRIPKDGGTTPKGFLRDWFEDAFTRYLPPAAGVEPVSDFSVAQNPSSEPDTPDTTLKTKDFLPKSNPTQDTFVSGSKSEIPVGNQHCVGCVGFEAGFSGGEKRKHSDSAGEAPEAQACVQCNGEIDGTERLVAVSGRAVWLHLECERYWVRALKERER